MKNCADEDKEVEEFIKPAQKPKPSIKNNTSQKIVDVYAPTQIILDSDSKSPSKPQSNLTFSSSNAAEKKEEEKYDDSNGTQKIEEEEPIEVNVIPPAVQKLAMTSWSLVSEASRNPQKVE